MLAADMDLAETVLRDAGHLQQHLVQGRVFALRNGLQRLGTESIGAGAEARLNLKACGVEFLRDDFNRIEGDCGCSGIGRCLRSWRRTFRKRGRGGDCKTAGTDFSSRGRREQHGQFLMAGLDPKLHLRTEMLYYYTKPVQLLPADFMRWRPIVFAWQDQYAASDPYSAEQEFVSRNLAALARGSRQTARPGCQASWPCRKGSPEFRCRGTP